MPTQQVKQGQWEALIKSAQDHIRAAQSAIDLASQVTDDAEVDMRLCFASNALHGPLALLREASTVHHQLDVPAMELVP